MATVAPWFGIAGTTLGRSLPIMGASRLALTPHEPTQRTALPAVLHQSLGTKKRNGHEEERAAEKRVSFSVVEARIKELDDWRGKLLGRLRMLVKEADTEVVEEWKWRGVRVWSQDGLICTGESYKNLVKMTFAKGAAPKDPSGLFNGNTRRAIDFHEGDKIDEDALKALVRAAVSLNKSTAPS
jgi:hypothetical protein